MQQQSVGTHIRFDYISCHNTNLIKCLIEFRFDGGMHERNRCACDGRQERLIFPSDHTQTTQITVTSSGRVNFVAEEFRLQFSLSPTTTRCRVYSILKQ